MAANKKSKSGWTQNRHPIFGGKAEILQTAASNGVWQFRCFISEEGKYVRKSLRTRDFESACALAEKEYLQIYSDVSSGKKLFGIKLRELVDLYLEKRLEHAEEGLITQGRLTTIKSQLKHFLEYKDGRMKLAELTRKSALGYAKFRRQQGAKDVTIRNEQATINAVIKWGFDNGYLSVPKLEFDPIKITEPGRRDTFTVEEYDRLTRYMRSWTNRKNTLTEEERLEKFLVRDFILILSNTFLRVGEARQLKWGDVKSMDYTLKENNSLKTPLVYLKVREETSKNRRSRDVITRGGRYFQRLKERSKFTEDNDFVFSDINESTIFPKGKLYRYWHDLMTHLGLEYKERNLSFYSLRHFGITMRLSAGVSVWDISRIAGTGVAFIEKHYGHATHEMMLEAAVKENTAGGNLDFGLLIKR